MLLEAVSPNDEPLETIQFPLSFGVEGGETRFVGNSVGFELGFLEGRTVGKSVGLPLGLDVG